MVLTTLIAWPVQNFVMAPFGLEYFQTLLFVLVILAVVYCLKALVKKDICFPLIVLNSAVLGVTLQNISATFVQALVGALGAGLGLMVAMLLFAGARGKVNDKYVPASLRGLPVDLMTAAILAMAVMAF